MIKEDLKEIINSLKEIDYDTSSIEIKSGKGGFPKRIWQTISAFANTPGCLLHNRIGHCCEGNSLLISAPSGHLFIYPSKIMLIFRLRKSPDHSFL